MKTKEAVLLDVGGVLVLSRRNEVFQAWATTTGKDIDTVRNAIRGYNSILAHGNSLSSSTYLSEHNIDWIDATSFEKLRNELWDSEYVNQELIAYLIKQKESYVYALLTNNFKGIEQILDKKYNIPTFYNQIINSSEVGFTKPDIRIFQHALNVLEKKPEQCIFVDDKLENVQAATSLGMTGIMYKDFHQFTKALEKSHK